MALAKKRYADNPAYQIPLDATQLGQLGSIFAVWGQIDFHIVMLIALILKMEPSASVALLDSVTSGTLVGHLRKSIGKIQYDTLKIEVKEFCDRMGGLIEKRNHISHGIWGWLVNDKQNFITPACHYHKASEKPLKASELEDLLKRITAESRAISSILNQYQGSYPVPNEGGSAAFYIAALAGQTPSLPGGVLPQPGRDHRLKDQMWQAC
jgi:hypothetical protein